MLMCVCTGSISVQCTVIKKCISNKKKDITSIIEIAHQKRMIKKSNISHAMKEE